jgi:hypothetical protein
MTKPLIGMLLQKLRRLKTGGTRRAAYDCRLRSQQERSSDRSGQKKAYEEAVCHWRQIASSRRCSQ